MIVPSMCCELPSESDDLTNGGHSRLDPLQVSRQHSASGSPRVTIALATSVKSKYVSGSE